MSSSRTPVVTPMAVGAVALAVFAAVVGLRLALHDGDPSVFVLAGDGLTDRAAAPDSLHVEPGIRGYDGQAFYRFARPHNQGAGG